MLSQLLTIVWVSHLEELKQHVIKVGGHVHDAYGWVLLTCRETESSSSNTVYGSIRSNYSPSGEVLSILSNALGT